jgi:hypothetical protein
MDMISRLNQEVESHDSGGLNRRTVLITAAAAASAAAGVSPVLADTAPTANFGAPLAELYLPHGILTLEQRAALLKGMTDVVLNAMKLPPDPARPSFVQILETVEGGFGVNGQVFVARAK